jgi:hypothetical protein
MKSSRFLLFSILLIITFIAAGIAPLSTASALDDRGDTIPVLKSPHGTIVDSTPTYKWAKVAGATKYQYEVYQGTTKVLDVIIENSVCGTAYCTNTPTHALKSNAHKWRVRARISGSWKAWSAYMNFFRSASAFDSQFNGTMDGWARKAGGIWDFDESKYLVSNGLPEKYTSVYNTSGKFSDFDFTTLVVRESETNDPSYVAVRMGSSIGKAERWYPGYLFGFSHDGTYGIFRLSAENGVTILQPWTPTTAIVTYNWNYYRVVAKGSSLKFYINGVLQKSLNDSTYRNGYVGIMMFRSSVSEHPRIVIDYAKLTPIKTPQ